MRDYMDNRIFNVNGYSKEYLEKTLALAFGKKKCVGYKFIKEKGLLLLDYANNEDKEEIIFPAPIDSSIMTGIIWAWLTSPQAKEVPCDGWDADADHDGSNSKGWRLYIEEWGRVASKDNVIIAVKPAYMWHGK